MKNKFQLIIGSGKGGVGKSMLASSLAILFSKEKNIIALDCDADAPNLNIWLGNTDWDKKEIISTTKKAVIDNNLCNNCGKCKEACRFGAIKEKNGLFKVIPYFCEGCGACKIACPQGAIRLESVENGEIRVKKTNYGFLLISGNLYPGSTGSGEIVDQVKEESKKFDTEMIIIDSAPGTGCPVNAAFRGADFAILITEPTLSGITDLRKSLAVVRHFNIPFKIVVNKWDINKKNFQKIKQEFKEEYLGRLSYDSQVVKEISNLTPVLEGSSKVKEEIQILFKEIKALK